MDTTLATLLSDLEALADKPFAHVHPADLAVRAEGCGYRIDYSPQVWSRQGERLAFVGIAKHLEQRQWTTTDLGGYLFAR